MKDDLYELLLGGQSFSWREEDGCYSAVLDDRIWKIKSLDDIKDPFLRNYFDLDFDYEKARNELKKKDEYLNEAVSLFPSLRILRQDPFVTMISFILSQNNNIKRITMIYDRISRSYGKEIEKGYYSFPAVSELSRATEEDFYSLGCGFRSKYLVDAIKKHEILYTLDNLSYEEAKARLETIKGIGPKVADCILLFAYHRMEAFPLDVWMKKVMSNYYPDKDISYFQPYPALAQQYLFSWIRQKKISL